MTILTAQPMRLALMGVALLLGSTGCAGNPPPTESAIWVSYAPPHAPREVRPRRPGRTYVWIAGYYRWTSTEYVWVRGHWEDRPAPRAKWRKGGWYHGNRGWYWVEGHWAGR